MTRAVCVAVLLVAMVAMQPVAGVVLTKCQAAKQLYSAGIAKSLLPDWLCLIQHESSYNTAATHTNTNGSTDYGLFQINSTYWCGKTAVGGDCNLRCSSLTNNDISDDIKCAQLIYKRQGFNAWYGWKNYCQTSGAKPSISDCSL